MMMSILTNYLYLLSVILFILGIKKLSSPITARQGNLMSALGMLIAVIVTLVNTQLLGIKIIGIGLLVGSLIGVIIARFIQMTAMPQMVALLNGLGGAASLLLAWGAFLAPPSSAFFSGGFVSFIVGLSIIIGGITLSGSCVAWGKLAELIPGRPTQYTGQQFLNIGLLIGIIFALVSFVVFPTPTRLLALIVISILLGISAVIAIGGGDMPVVIALLNSYSGIAASAAGLVIGHLVLIVVGLLVGASGIILTIIMCKAMNRTLRHVLFAGFGTVANKQGSTQLGEINPISSDDAYLILESARSVVIVPGYGMAVAQAQHIIHELSDLLADNGCDVRFAIHPVAGRMPGHMNVLLAEANVPYEQLIEMDHINPTLDSVDVCIVIGANDVVNPSALEDASSSIYGMPIIEVMKAKTVFVLKRSMNPGFAGIENPLFYKENTRMLFGDAKTSISNIVSAFKS